MAIRSIASLSLTFGLVSIPVKVYLATESSAAVKFKLMAANGARLRQQYVAHSEPTRYGPALHGQDSHAEDSHAEDWSAENWHTQADEPAHDPATRGLETGPVVWASHSSRSRPSPLASDPVHADDPHVIERAQMVKAYEFERGQYVLFTAAELKALQSESRQTIDIVSFIPEQSVDPIYYDKAYFLAPDKRGGKPYSLLRRAMQESARCALAKWAWRSKEYVVQIRPARGGMVLQQLLYADEVRSLEKLEIELTPVGETELKLATQLIEQIAESSYDPHAFVDEEKQRILAAVQSKIAGQQIVSHGLAEAAVGAQVVDLVAALRASLGSLGRARSRRREADAVAVVPSLQERKPPRRAPARAVAKSPRVRKS